jgi:tetratricopeptide (TPR) repeat protein
MKEVAPTWYWHITPLAGDPRPPRKEQKPASRERMRREIKDLFEELSRTASIVLFLDDLHWADISTCDLIAYLGACLPQLRLLILMACRPTAVQSRANAFRGLKLDLERRGICREMRLPFLTLSDIREYIDRRFPRNQFPPEFAVLVHQRTDGNPLFMIDLLRFLRDRQVLEERNGIWTVGQPLREAAMIVPDGIGSMIKLKLDQLTADDLQLLSTAAVQGIQFDSSVLAQVLRRSPADVEERLQELDTACNLVRAVEEREYNQLISIRCRFVHTYYQNALYAALAPSRRAGYSLAVAEALVALTGGTSRDVAADVAMLFEGGRDYAKAALHFFHAARNAARLFAYPEAVILSEHGLGVLALTPESRERDAQELGLRLILNLALMATRGYAAPEVEASHRRSLELCRKCQETRRLPAVLWGLHTCEVNRGQLMYSLELAHRLEDLAKQTQDTATTIQSLHALGTSLAFMGRLTEAHDVLERIFALEAASPQPSGSALFLLDARVTSTSMMARLLTYLGHLDRALERAAESLEYARSLAHPQSIAYATFWLGWIRHAIGDHEESCRDLEVAMNLSHEYGLALILEWGRVVRGSVWARLGRIDEGIGEIRESLRRQQAMGSLLERSYCLTLLAEALGLEGSYSEAASLCDEALEFARRTEGRSYEPETHRVRGELMLNMGADSLPLIQQELETAIHIARERKCRLLELRAAVGYFRVQQRTGTSPSARPLLTSAVASFGNQTFPILSEARGLLEIGTIP